MRTSITGPFYQENLKLTNEYVKNWNKFKISEKSLEIYNKISTISDKDNLYKLLNECIDDVMSYKKTDYVIFPINVIDILLKFFILKSKDDNFADDLLIQKVIQLTKQALHFYDIIYFVPYLEKYNNIVLDDEIYVYIKELNNFYLEVQESYTNMKKWLFDFGSVDGVAALIEIFGNIDEQIQMLKLYQNNDGEPYGSSDSLLQDVINN